MLQVFLKKNSQVKKLTKDPIPEQNHTQGSLEDCSRPDCLDKENTFKVLHRQTSNKLTQNSDTPVLYPILPYHQRWEQYLAKRKEIFEDFPISNRKPKRSTLRLRRYYKQRRFISKFCISSIVNNAEDKRFYASVKFLTFSELGLLDTGANVSCIGADLANTNFDSFREFFPLKTSVKTADGNIQRVTGYLEVPVEFKNSTHKMRLLIVPSISQRLILGLDFWKSFQLAPDLFGSIVFSSSNEDSSKIVSEMSESNLSVPKISNSHDYPLSPSQRQQLAIVIDLFPNCDKQGLGRTPLIRHHMELLP